MKNNLLLQADPQFAVCLNTQIKEQLKWLIGLNEIRSGELLPPAAQLADVLKVNRNTVHLVYTQLRDERIVSIQKGRGTEVLDNEHVAKLRRDRKHMHALMAHMTNEAKEQGLSLEEFVTAGTAYIQLFEPAAAPGMRILFVECKEHDYGFYQREVARHTGAQVDFFCLQEAESQPREWQKAVQQADWIVATLNHSDEVRKLLPGKQHMLVTIGATVDTAALLQMAQLSQGAKVVFACLGKKGGQWMSERVKDAGLHNLDCVPQGWNHREELLAQMEKADTVYASGAIYEQLHEVAPGKVKLYPLVLEKSSERLLKELSHKEELK
ncbi:GntR family transcriptional regulator [Marinicrinis sediminis]|uniref:GntR family transcriptional regulator n=1 Tax=Marinicrinis sediminis TaxID=1652465 RepID=A0ABW5R7H8_9BACL